VRGQNARVVLGGGGGGRRVGGGTGIAGGHRGGRARGFERGQARCGGGQVVLVGFKS